MAIIHVDVNSAFLSWTAIKLLESGYGIDIREIPSVIAAGDDASRHAIVLAKSTPAKKFGIKTADTMFSARKACPGLVSFYPDFELFKYHSDRMYELLTDYSPVIERYSIDECFIDYTGCEGLHGDPLTAAKEINRRIREELGFTVNVGVGENRFCAKMASDFEKPDKVHTLWPDEIKDKLWPLDVSDMFMCGRSSAKKLHNININTIGDLAKADLALLTNLFKSHGQTLHNFANGIDDSPVSINDDVKEKSIGNSITTKTDLLTAQDASPIIRWLCEKTVSRLREAGYLTTVITLQFRNSDFNYYSHQMKLPFGMHTVDEIYSYAMNLFNEAWKGEPLRLLGVSLGGLVTETSEQLSLFDTPKEESKIDHEKSEALESALAEIRDKFGHDAIGRIGGYQKGARKPN